MELLTPVNTRDISSIDIINHHKKVVLDKYMRKRIEHPTKKVSSIASDLGVSHSTITRYGYDLGIPKRSTRVLTPEQKSAIQLKAADTKRTNQEYKQQLAEISRNAHRHILAASAELKRNFIRNKHQFIQQLSGVEGTVDTAPYCFQLVENVPGFTLFCRTGGKRGGP